MGIESTFFPSLYFFNGAGCNPTLRPKPADKKDKKPIEKKSEIRKEVPKAAAPDYMVLYKQGVAAYEKGKIRLAVQILRQVIVLKKDFAEAYYYLGVCFYCNGVESGSQNDHKNAINFLNQAIALNKRYAKAYFARAQVYSELKNYREALKDNFRANVINPKYGGASFSTILREKIAEEISARIKIVRETSWVNRGKQDFSPQNAIHKMVKIDEEVCSKKQIDKLYNIASEMLMMARATLNKYPSLSIKEKIEVIFYIIAVKFFSIKIEDRINSHTLANDLSDKALDCDTISWLLKIILSELKNHFKGTFSLILLPEHVFLRYRNIDGEQYNFDQGAFYSEGEYKILFSMPEKAIRKKYYLHNVSLQEETALLLTNRGLTKEFEGKPEEAILDYRKAIALFPSFIMPYMNMATALVLIKKYEESIFFSQKARAMNPLLFNTYLNEANARIRLNQFDQALPLLGKALRLLSGASFIDRAIVYRAYGELYSKTKKNDQALLYFSQSLKSWPLYFNSLYARGEIYFLRKQYKKAKIDLSTVFLAYLREENTSDGSFIRKYYFKELTSAFYMLGYCLFKEKKYDEAVAKLKKLLSLDPKHQKAYYLLARIFYLQGKYRIAKEYFKKLIKLKPIYANDPLLRNIDQKLRVK